MERGGGLGKTGGIKRSKRNEEKRKKIDTRERRRGGGSEVRCLRESLE